MSGEKVIVNGVPEDEGYVSIDDRGFTLGDGLFETIPIYRGAPFLLAAHMERMRRGAEIIGLAPPVDEKKVSFAIAELVFVNRISRGVARLTVTRGLGARGYASAKAGPPTWVLTVRPYDPPEAKRRAGGYRLAIASRRVSLGDPLRSIKSIGSLDRVMAMDAATRAGADEALVLAAPDIISSAVAANIFWVNGGVLYTPSEGCAILPGVTRAAVLALAAKEGIKTVEGQFTLGDLAGAQEVFLTNSLIELTPVAGVEGVGMFVSPGPVMERLLGGYRRGQ